MQLLAFRCFISRITCLLISVKQGKSWKWWYFNIYPRTNFALKCAENASEPWIHYPNLDIWGLERINSSNTETLAFLSDLFPVYLLTTWYLQNICFYTTHFRAKEIKQAENSSWHFIPIIFNLHLAALKDFLGAHTCNISYLSLLNEEIFQMKIWYFSSCSKQWHLSALYNRSFKTTTFAFRKIKTLICPGDSNFSTSIRDSKFIPSAD